MEAKGAVDVATVATHQRLPSNKGRFVHLHISRSLVSDLKELQEEMHVDSNPAVIRLLVQEHRAASRAELPATYENIMATARPAIIHGRPLSGKSTTLKAFLQTAKRDGVLLVSISYRYCPPIREGVPIPANFRDLDDWHEVSKHCSISRNM